MAAAVPFAARALGMYAAKPVYNFIKHALFPSTKPGYKKRKAEVEDSHSKMPKRASGSRRRISHKKSSGKRPLNVQSRVVAKKRRLSRKGFKKTSTKVIGGGNVNIVSSKGGKHVRKAHRTHLSFKVDNFDSSYGGSIIGGWSAPYFTYLFEYNDIFDLLSNSRYMADVRSAIFNSTVQSPAQLEPYFLPVGTLAGGNHEIVNTVNEFTSKMFAKVPITMSKINLEVTNQCNQAALMEFFVIKLKRDLSKNTGFEAFFYDQINSTYTNMEQYQMVPNSGESETMTCVPPQSTYVNFDFWRNPWFKANCRIVNSKHQWIGAGESTIVSFDAGTPLLDAASLYYRRQTFPAAPTGAPQGLYQTDLFKGVTTIVMTRFRGKVCIVKRILDENDLKPTYGATTMATVTRKTFYAGMPIQNRHQRGSLSMQGSFSTYLPTYVGGGGAQIWQQTGVLNEEEDTVVAPTSVSSSVPPTLP